MFDEFVNIVRHPTIWHVETGAMARVLKRCLCEYKSNHFTFFSTLHSAKCKLNIIWCINVFFIALADLILTIRGLIGENYFNWHPIFLSSSAAMSIFLIFHILRYAVKPKIDWSNINQLYINDLEYKNRKTHAKSKKNGQNIILLRGNLSENWVSECVCDVKLVPDMESDAWCPYIVPAFHI